MGGEEFLSTLIEENILSEEDASKYANDAKSLCLHIIPYLLRNKIINSQLLAQHASTHYGLPLYDLSQHNIEQIPEKFTNLIIVKERLALPVSQNGTRLFIATVAPDLAELKNLNETTGMETVCLLVDGGPLEELIKRVQTEKKKSKKTQPSGFSNIASLTDDSSQTTSGDPQLGTENMRFLDGMIRDAIKSKASDIHFETYEDKFRVRYRQDGVLYEIASKPIRLAPTFISRLKVMANLNISEHRIPQDGRFQMTLSNKDTIDIRISTCPTLHGEKAVLRVLDSSIEKLNVDILGMSPAQKDIFLKSIKSSQGMILVTGPTGSGKTVTLYTALNIINSTEKNIMSIEDPVEIYMDGINQVQVNTKTGLSFSVALRSFLRQDPDIIMLGEVRDSETANIAIKASQTGHLVLSTLHTNNAILTISRLLNIGVQPFDIVSSVTLVIAQRLVRKLCPHCKIQLTKKEIQSHSWDAECSQQLSSKEIYGPGSCNQCRNGYSGRVGIFELLPMTESIAELILAEASVIEIAKQAHKEGRKTLIESGLEKVLQGDTSLDELNRVVVKKQEDKEGNKTSD